MMWLIILLVLALGFVVFFISEPLRIKAERSGNDDLARAMPVIVSGCIVIGLMLLFLFWFLKNA